jgi:hypothetical protein
MDLAAHELLANLGPAVGVRGRTWYTVRMPHTARLLLGCCLVTLVGAGCPSPAAKPPDAGFAADATPLPDAEPLSDAEPLPDAEPVDTGPAPDLGTRLIEGRIAPMGGAVGSGRVRLEGTVDSAGRGCSGGGTCVTGGITH